MKGVQEMLEIRNVTKKYHKTLAVDNVSFTVNKGRIGILLGPNGAGKSTIIKSIAGLLKYNGEIYIDGFHGRTLDAKRIFSYVPELPAMYDALTIKEHLEFVIKAYGLPQEAYQYAEELMELFELSDKQDKFGNELSKGMMQKVSICCGLLTKPSVILLDEPMVGLDPKAIKVLKEKILQLKEEGTTILVSTHMLEMVAELWDDLFIMNQGKILGEFAKENVGDKDIEQIFFGLTGGESA